MNALVTIEALTAVQVFVEGDPEALISKLEGEIRALPARDMKVKADREETRSLAAKIARSKTGLDDLGKDYVAEIKKQAGVIDAKRKLIRDRLDALKDEVRAPLTAWEDAEKARVENHESALVWIVQAWQLEASTVCAIEQRIGALMNEYDRNWEEFAERAGEAFNASLAKLREMREAAVQAEADRVELEMLRRQKAEREARDAAERAAAEKAERDRLAEEAAANRAAAAAERAAQAERDRAVKAIKDAQEAAQRAEAAAARAVEEERARVAAADAKAKAEQERLERNKKHRAKIHREILADLAVAKLDTELGMLVIEAIAAGKIRNVSITY